MSLTLLPVNVIQLFAIAWCVLGVLVAWRQPRRQGLAGLLVLVCVLQLFNFAEELGLWRGPLITPALMLGFGPAIFFFARHMVGLPALAVPQIGLHGAPVLLALPFTGWPQWVLVAASISQLLYTVAALGLLRDYHHASRQQRSDADEQALYWLRNLLCFWVVMELQDHVRLHLQGQLPLASLLAWYTLNSALYTLMIGYLVVKAATQPALFNGMQTHCEAPPAPDEDPGPVFLAIDTHLREGGGFRQPRLSLRELAGQLGLQEKLVSWAINRGSGQSFCDYINGLRVQAVCEYLQTAEQPVASLLQVAFDQGFNAKTSFNSAFKKVTAMTPSQYYRGLREVRNPDTERPGAI